MTPTAQSSSGSTNATTSPLDRAKRLASTLLSERGEASGALLARELHGVLRALDAGDRQGFQRYLATEFQPDTRALRIAAERYLANTTAEAAAALAKAAASGGRYAPPAKFRAQAVKPQATTVTRA
jgi:malonyl-CoA decarboxylase